MIICHMARRRLILRKLVLDLTLSTSPETLKIYSMHCNQCARGLHWNVDTWWLLVVYHWSHARASHLGNRLHHLPGHWSSSSRGQKSLNFGKLATFNTQKFQRKWVSRFCKKCINQLLLQKSVHKLFRCAKNWHTRWARWCNNYNIDNNLDNQAWQQYWQQSWQQSWAQSWK